MTDRRASIPGRTSHVVAAVALLAMGCAPTYSTAQVQAVGEYQSGAKEAFGQKYRELQKSDDERPSAAANVKVLDETVPPQRRHSWRRALRRGRPSAHHRRSL